MVPTVLDKNIFLLWLQGWDQAPVLQQAVLDSWKFQNPTWTVHEITSANLRQYVSDIDYVFDNKIQPQAKSDIIRLSLLKNHGGVWADATLMCMQPLDSWVNQAVEPAGLWMYHGHGAGMHPSIGPASWFIVSNQNGELISQWKEKCDVYWHNVLSQVSPNYPYFWMDLLFRKLCETNQAFLDLWNTAPYLYADAKGQSHTLAQYKMEGRHSELQEMFKTKPPYVLKMWKGWSNQFPYFRTKPTNICLATNGYVALQLATTQQTIYDHFTDPLNAKEVTKWNRTPDYFNGLVPF